MTKIIKKVLMLCIVLTFAFCFVKPVEASDLPDGESYLYSTKTGTLSKVYHYGTGSAVTLPNNYFAYEAEMRGVWVATVYNIAIGKQTGTTKTEIEAYKNEFLTILNRMEEFGMNTIFFQIRPSNDAFYRSELNPWSQFLVGPGVDPGWDPLEWMIEETHKRGFDFQCWMNAYRVTTESVLPDSKKKASFYSNEQLISFKQQAINGLADGNFAKLHPEYVVMGEADTRLILNPSEVAVQDFIVATLKEIIENYDIDGMHFDDYFYLNGDISSDTLNTNFAGGKNYDNSLTGINILNDLGNYQEYLNNDPKYSHMERGYNLGDFRRENVNTMMRKIRKMVDEYNLENNDCVEFGSKPAAVWRSNSEYCNGSSRCSEIGSNTSQDAYSSYSDLFADTWKWVEEGLVDYVAPQVYYAFEDNYAPYADVVDWWAKMVTELNATRTQEGLKEIKLYIAHGIYKYRDNADQFYNPSEIRNQIVYNKKYPAIKGSALYSYENLYIFNNTQHERGISYLKNNWVNNPVYPLPHGTDDSKNLKVEDYTISKDLINNKIIIQFLKPVNSRVYGLYKVLKGMNFDQTDLSTRIMVKYDPYVENQNEIIEIDDYDENYDYYLKVISKNGYISSETTKIDFSKVDVFESIKLHDLSLINSEILCDEQIKISLKVDNPLNKDLSYNVWYYEKGINKHREIAKGNVVNGEIAFIYKAYPYETSESSLHFEVSDGVNIVEFDTPRFNIVRTRTMPYIFSCNKFSQKYMPSLKLPLELQIKNPSNSSFNYIVKLINEATLEEKIICEESNISSEVLINQNFEIKDEGIYHVLICVNQDGKSNYYQTSTFEISMPNLSENVLINITYNDSQANVSITLDEICRNYNYEIALIDENGEVIFVLESGVIKSNSLSTYWYVGTDIYKNVRIKLTIGYDTWNNIVFSEKYSFNVVEEPDPNPNPINPPIENPINKGCNCKKNTIFMITNLISVVSLVFVLRKKR